VDESDFSFRRRHLGRALARAFWLIEEQLDAGIRARFPDYRASDGQVFRCLPVDKGARIVELAERAKMTKQGMSKLVASLDERGYVERVPDPEDGRAQIIQFTPRGRAALAAASEAIAEIEARWAEVIGQDELEVLRETLLIAADTLGGSDYL